MGVQFSTQVKRSNATYHWTGVHGNVLHKFEWFDLPKFNHCIEKRVEPSN